MPADRLRPPTHTPGRHGFDIVRLAQRLRNYHFNSCLRPTCKGQRQISCLKRSLVEPHTPFLV